MLRRILRLDTCNVSEISLFRAASEWAERVCAKNRLPLTGENKNAVLGQATLLLIRFPCMTVDEFQWEVVPTGMLPYADVQSLLQTLTSRNQGFGSSFNANPRDNKSVKNKDLDACFDQAGSFLEASKPIYNCNVNDALDCMLGAELLRAFLNQTAEDIAKKQAQSSSTSQPSTPSASRAKLPPLTPRSGGASKATLEPLAPESPSRGGRPQRQHRAATATMIMGCRIDTEQADDGIVVQGGGKRPTPIDFLYLAPGFYKFRDEFLIEIWLREGEAMVTNHGHNVAINAGSAQFAFADAPVDVETARASLKIPYGKAVVKGGVPLVAFLCRQ